MGRAAGCLLNPGVSGLEPRKHFRIFGYRLPCWPCRNWNEEEAERQLFEFTGLLLSFSGDAVRSLIWLRWSKFQQGQGRILLGLKRSRTVKPAQAASFAHETIVAWSHAFFKWYHQSSSQVLADLCSTSFNSWPRHLVSVVA